MKTVEVRLRSIVETEAAVGWADGHTVMVDRPDGKAGGQGLGFNGAQLLALIDLLRCCDICARPPTTPMCHI